MKNLIKKGFTIVELVIVIAVIVILAGVLIPTFSGIVDKANQNAALQTARSTLTNALNMSSTAQLQGEDTNGYHTVFVIDGYAFGYTGNQLEATNYPGSGSTAALTSGATYENSVWTKNFNAIAICSENLVEVVYTEATANEYNLTLSGAAKNGDATPADYKTKVGSDAAGTNLTAEEAIAYNAKLTGAKKAGDTEYNLTVAISNTISSASDFQAIDSNATKGYTVTKTNGSYTVSDGHGHNAALYVNSDFSKSVVVFTIFSN